MLKPGEYINILIAFGHIVGLFWADKMFKVTGIGREMTETCSTTLGKLKGNLKEYYSIRFMTNGESMS